MENKYKALLLKATKEGIFRADRTGVGCNSLFAESLEFDLSTGYFPLITAKKMFLKNIFTELLWFLRGETNIERFKKANVHIWDNWADENGELGPVYGYQMRNFNGQGIDQLKETIKAIKDNPDSRRHIISLWNPAQTKDMRLPPCYHNFQFFVEKDLLHMHILQRSADLFIGVPYDIAMFSLFLHHVAQQTGKIPGKIKLTMIDAHVYVNHLQNILQYTNAEIYPFPKITFNSLQDFEIVDYQHGPFIKSSVAI